MLLLQPCIHIKITHTHTFSHSHCGRYVRVKPRFLSSGADHQLIITADLGGGTTESWVIRLRGVRAWTCVDIPRGDGVDSTALVVELPEKPPTGRGSNTFSFKHNDGVHSVDIKALRGDSRTGTTVPPFGRLYVQKYTPSYGNSIYRAVAIHPNPSFDPTCEDEINKDESDESDDRGTDDAASDDDESCDGERGYPDTMSSSNVYTPPPMPEAEELEGNKVEMLWLSFDPDADPPTVTRHVGDHKVEKQRGHYTFESHVGGRPDMNDTRALGIGVPVGMSKLLAALCVVDDRFASLKNPLWVPVSKDTNGRFNTADVTADMHWCTENIGADARPSDTVSSDTIAVDVGMLVQQFALSTRG